MEKSLDVEDNKKEIKELTEKLKETKINDKIINNNPKENIAYDEWAKRRGYPTLEEQIAENEKEEYNKLN